MMGTKKHVLEVHVEYQKACTGADKFNGDTGRGPRPPKGVEGPKKEAESL